MTVSWVSLLVDTPAARVPAAVAFWAAVTGHQSRPSDEPEYTTLVPSVGDVYVSVQSIGSGTPGWHPDLHVADLSLASQRAVDLGAEVTAHRNDLDVLRSPAGLAFCLAAADRPAWHVPSPASWPGGRSVLDQICLDIPHDDWDAECRFWSALTEWELFDVDVPEFRRLASPPGLAVQFLLQRLGADDTGPMRAHADFASSDRDAETRRHLAAGARLVRRDEHWTVLHDPATNSYCITDRRPTNVGSPTA